MHDKSYIGQVAVSVVVVVLILQIALKGTLRNWKTDKRFTSTDFPKSEILFGELWHLRSSGVWFPRKF